MVAVGNITRLLGQLHAGDESARAALFATAYDGLQQLAHARLRGGGRNTMLDTCSLVHESYLRCVQSGALRAADRRAFFAYASQVMRSVIVGSVRERAARKRGAGLKPLTLSTRLGEQIPAAEDTILGVHEAMELLERVEPRLAQVAQMRYFGGYSEREIADALQVTERTVQRLWLKARLMLQAALDVAPG
jgi:RNA polymerase sigma factor (TIGR02999 family)